MTDPTAPLSEAPRAPHAIQVTAVRKTYGQVTALAGVDLAVETGTLTALLGPNGAGKTTLVRIIATLARPDAGQVRVFGYDVTTQGREVRARIGLTGQYAGLDDALSGHDNLMLVGRLAGLARGPAAVRAAELTGALGLTDTVFSPGGRPPGDPPHGGLRPPNPPARRLVRTYSGGMRRRLDLAASLMHKPDLLVLDEPTTGLDPGSRQQLWAILTELKAAGTTMLLTTQYLEEADRFADLVHVLHHGKVIATGTPGQLKSMAGGQGTLDDAFLALTSSTTDGGVWGAEPPRGGSPGGRPPGANTAATA